MMPILRVQEHLFPWPRSRMTNLSFSSVTFVLFCFVLFRFRLSALLVLSY